VDLGPGAIFQAFGGPQGRRSGLSNAVNASRRCRSRGRGQTLVGESSGVRHASSILRLGCRWRGQVAR